MRRKMDDIFNKMLLQVIVGWEWKYLRIRFFSFSNLEYDEKI